MNKEDPPIIIEETFNKSIGEVWSAITDHKLMIKWFFDNIPDFKPAVGFKTEFNIENGDRNFFHLWEIIEVIPNKKIVYNWKYDKYPGEALVFFELNEEEEYTKLTLTNKVLETFPQDIPEFKRESCIGGWDYFIKQSLKEFLNK